MTFKPGNKLQNPRKDKPWRIALHVALKSVDPEALRWIAERCVLDAMNGDKDARREIAERIDGKVPQEAKIELGPLEDMSEDELRSTLEALNTYLSTVGQSDGGTSSEAETRH